MLFQHETEKWQYQSAGAIDHWNPTEIKEGF
jgi:hypothetical protein